MKAFQVSSIIVFLTCNICLSTYAQEDDYFVLDDTLDPVEMTLDDARKFFREFLDIRSLNHNVAVKKMSEDPKLVSYLGGFKERNEIDAITFSYIEGNKFWEEVFNSDDKREWNTADGDLVKGRIVFERVGDESGGGYDVYLEIKAGSQKVYELFSLFEWEFQEIVEECEAQFATNQKIYDNPGEAHQSVINALIGALAEIERFGKEEIVGDSVIVPIDSIEFLVGSALISIQGKEYKHGDTVYLSKTESFNFTLTGTAEFLTWRMLNKDGDDVSDFQYGVDFETEELSFPSSLIYDQGTLRALYGNEKTDLTITACEFSNIKWDKQEIEFGKKDTATLEFFTNVQNQNKVDVWLLSQNDTLVYKLSDEIVWSNYSNGSYASSGDQEIVIQFRHRDHLIYETSTSIEVISNFFIGDPEVITSAAEEAVEWGTSFVGNESTAACNICTRAALYITTGRGDQVLFPKKGSHIGDTLSPYLKGDITDPGKANNIYDDLNNTLVPRFQFIPDMEDEDYPDFAQLQDQVNAGQIVIGTLRNYEGGSGHVVMIVPGVAKEYNSRLKFLLSDGLTKIKLPMILECGSDHRESHTDIFDNMSEESIKELRWYKLTSSI